MIFEFRPVGHLILISIRRIFPGASHFSKRCSSTVYMKLALDLVGQIFLKMMLGTCLNEITKKIQGGGGSTMDDAMLSVLLILFASCMKVFITSENRWCFLKAKSKCHNIIWKTFSKIFPVMFKAKDFMK